MRRLHMICWLLAALGLLTFVGLNKGRTLLIVQANPRAQATDFDCTTVAEIPQLECEALVALYNATDGPNWMFNTGWLVTNSPCGWAGLTCADAQVTQLSLSWNRLSGAIPPEIGNLMALQSLNLGTNLGITSIPPEIGNLSHLQSLSLGVNSLTHLPTEIGNLTALQSLWLGYNRLTELPSGIGNLANLTTLTLYNNQLTSLPPEIGNLTNLTSLPLYNNQLTSLPSEIGNLTNLTSLSLYNNQLTSLPSEIGSLTNLTWLSLYNNQLTSLPSEIGNLTSLTSLSLYNNQLTGLPPQVGSLSNLTWLHVYNNQLTGLPSEIGNMTNLTDLRLYNNQLTSLPPEIGNLTNLIQLPLYNNRLASLPSTIGNLTALPELNLGSNRLNSLPPEIGNLTNLQNLNLSANQLITLPAEIGNLSSLRWLWLTENQLSSLPPEIGNLTLILGLPTEHNQLTNLPPEIGNLTTLRWFYLDGNQLTSLPSEIGNLSSLTTLGLSHNELTSLPAEIGNLSQLTQLQVYNNPLSGPLPSSLTPLSLNTFWFNNTMLCVPDDMEIQNWLATITTVVGTGLACGQPAGGLMGEVTDSDGRALSGAYILLYRTTSGSTRIFVAGTATNEEGQYTFSKLGHGIDYYTYFQDGISAPKYFENKLTLASADPITITLGLTHTVDAQLDTAQSPLVIVDLINGSTTTNTNPADGIVHIMMPLISPTTLTLSYIATCADGGTPSTVVLNYNSQQYIMVISNNHYQVSIPEANVVASTPLTITTSCTEGDTTVTVGAIILYNPIGIITDALSKQPIARAKITLYQVPGWFPRTGPVDMRPNTCESNNSKGAGIAWSQPAPTDRGVLVNTEQTMVSPLVNVQHTNDAGYYSWDLPQGCWYVVVEAEGYDLLVSPVVGTSSEVTDLHLALVPTTRSIYLPIIVR
jgi:Leucine-rich repeat (LRR) protein